MLDGHTGCLHARECPSQPWPAVTDSQVRSLDCKVIVVVVECIVIMVCKIKRLVVVMSAGLITCDYRVDIGGRKFRISEIYMKGIILIEIG